MPPSTRLGPFELGPLLGAGGMAQVFAAHHVALGVDVAIKVLHKHAEISAHALRAEVQAMARLDHPHVVRVFDYGVADGGVLGRGTPWFAMERLGSDLQTELLGIGRWEDVAPYVVQLLDALAHAHARGVIHRDLKLGNVLVGRAEDLRPGLKLVDFGIAAVNAGSAKGVGTPSAMAPEQWSRSLSDVGPWTDLYALGTMIWRVVTGGRPTGETFGPAIHYRQQTEDFEPFLPRFRVPEGLEPWLRTAMAFRPEERFVAAADARQALVAAGALTMGLPTVRIEAPGPSREPTQSSHVTVPVPAWDPEASERPLRPAPQATPVPSGWREDLPEPPSLHLAGVGLSLLPWREGATVGREVVREALWRTTRHALRRQQPLRVALTGPRRVGAAAVGRWWVQRLRTSSGVLAVVADTDLDGLIDGLLQPLGPAGDLAGRRRGLERWRADFRAARDALEVLDDDAGLETRVGATLEVLRAVGRRRPVAVFVQGQGPGLRRLVERADEVEEGVVWVARVAAAPPGWLEQAVAPMPDVELSMWLDQMLPVAPTLHRAMVAASGGLPGRLRQLLLEVLPRLRPGPGGFEGTLPTAERTALDGLSDLGEVALRRLEVAVAPGASVHRAVWVRAAGLAPADADALTERLLRRGVASLTPSGFLLEPELAEALQRRAATAGRDRAQHEATARVLESLHGDPLSIAQCWAAAGVPERAARRLLDGWGRVLRLHGSSVAAGALADVQALLASLPPEEALHGRAAVLALDLRQETGAISHAEAVALEEEALGRGWFDTACHAARLQAWVQTGDQALVDAIYRRVDRDYLARCSLGYQARMKVAWYLRLERFADPRRDALLEDVRAVTRHAIAASEGAERLLVELEAATAERARCGRDGDPAEHVAVARRCVGLSRRVGAAKLCVDLVELGAALAAAGDPDGADEVYAEAARWARWVRVPRSEAFATGNRAGLAGLRGDWVRAGELARRALVTADHPYLRAVLELLGSVPLAGAGRDRELVELLQRLGPTLAVVRPIDPEVRAALEAILCDTAGRTSEVSALARELLYPENPTTQPSGV